MSTLFPDMSIQQFQFFVREVYEIPNNRHFDIGEMLNQIQRFGMRGIKGIRKKDIEKIKKNLIISFSFFMSILNRLNIDIGEEIWKRFPYLCSYCNSCPCSCKEKKSVFRQVVYVDESKRPQTLSGFQKMFNEIYPASSRTLEHAGVHLAEETGEFSEAIWAYRSNRTDEEFKGVMFEAADYFSCLVGVFNSLNINFAEEISKFYPHNCHKCGNSPCVCSYEIIKNYES
ncbi:hypothetical protein HYT25_04760 [Candidatus Pacearchaeota archaeon]|nr:hypothetical protein [Candidatus Pacearchaeota archaeon]